MGALLEHASARMTHEPRACCSSSLVDDMGLCLRRCCAGTHGPRHSGQDPAPQRCDGRPWRRCQHAAPAASYPCVLRGHVTGMLPTASAQNHAAHIWAFQRHVQRTRAMCCCSRSTSRSTPESMSHPADLEVCWLLREGASAWQVLQAASCTIRHAQLSGCGAGEVVCTGRVAGAAAR